MSSTMGATLDSSSAIFGFNSVGVGIYGGHEMMIQVRNLCEQHKLLCTWALATIANARYLTSFR